jgi:hypothetical protein
MPKKGKVSTINIENHGSDIRVRDMRRELARILCRLEGDRKVTFSLTLRLGDPDGKS